MWIVRPAIILSEVELRVFRVPRDIHRKPDQALARRVRPERFLAREACVQTAQPEHILTQTELHHVLLVRRTLFLWLDFQLAFLRRMLKLLL